jgi:hypothetical protein
VVDAKVTTVTPDARAFFALGVGTSPLDIKIVQNNVMPLREVDPVSGVARSITLPGVAVEVPKGQSLFLVVAPVTDMFFGHGSRVPGALVLDDTVVRLPVPAAAPVEVKAASQTQPDVEGSRAGGTLPSTGPSGPAPVIGVGLLVAALFVRRRIAV